MKHTQHDPQGTTRAETHEGLVASAVSFAVAKPAPLRGIALLFWYLRLYFLISAQYIKARLSYRVDFFVSSLGMVLTILPGFLGILVVFQSIPDLAGWTLHELVFIYAFSLLALCPMQIVFDHLWQLRNKVQDGSFIKYYFRPLNMLFYFTSEMVDLKGFSQLVMGIVLMVWSSAQLELQWSIWLVAALIGLVLSASLIMVGLMLAGASAAFWIVNSFSILNLFSKFRDYARYPISIYSSALRFIFTALVPIGFIAFFPAQWILRSLSSGPEVWFTPLAGVLSFAFGAFVWSKGVRSWNGTGT